MINLARNMGGSSGIAICTTLIARREQFHQQRMIEHLSPLDAPYQSTLHSATQLFITKGADPAQAAAQAHGMIYNMVQQQAAMLSFNEVFWVLGRRVSGGDPADVSDEENRTGQRPCGDRPLTIQNSEF